MRRREVRTTLLERVDPTLKSQIDRWVLLTQVVLTS